MDPRSSCRLSGLGFGHFLGKLRFTLGLRPVLVGEMCFQRRTGLPAPRSLALPPVLLTETRTTTRAPPRPCSNTLKANEANFAQFQPLRSDSHKQFSSAISESHPEADPSAVGHRRMPSFWGAPGGGGGGRSTRHRHTPLVVPGHASSKEFGACALEEPPRRVCTNTYSCRTRARASKASSQVVSTTFGPLHQQPLASWA